MRFSFLNPAAHPNRSGPPSEIGGKGGPEGPLRRLGSALGRGLGRLYTPTICPVLGVEIPSADPVSAAGMAILRKARLNERNRCRGCFLPLNADSNSCDFCSGRNIYFDRHVSLFRMSPAWRGVLRRWKFENDAGLFRIFLPALRRELSRLLLQETDGASGVSGGGYRLGWIDSGRAGYETRAYTPCRELALALSDHTAIGRVGPLLRKRPLRSQSSKDYPDRFMRIRNSFEIHSDLNCKKSRNCRNGISDASGAPEKYILIEDVFTTGATANEAARLLKEHGAASVLIISVLLREELDFF